MVIPHPCVNVHVNNKGQKFKSDTTKIEKSLKNIIRKGYNLRTIVDSLRQVYFATI